MDLNFVDKMAACVKYAMNAKFVDYIDVCYEKSLVSSTTVKNGTFENIEDAVLDHFGIRIIHNKKQAIISKTNIDNYKQDLDLLIYMAANLPKDQALGAPARESVVKDGVYECKNIKRPSQKKLIDIALEIENGASNKVEVESAGVSYLEKDRFTLSSTGFFGRQSNSFLSCYSSVIARQDTFMEQGDAYQIFVNEPSNFSEVGFKSGEKALRKIGSKKIASCNMNVIIDRLAAREILADILSALNGNLIFSGGSMLGNHLNDRCFNSAVSILDDPSIENGLNSKSFDAEGSPVNPMFLVKHGHIRNYLLDFYSSQKLNIPNNFRAERTAGSVPFPCHTNVVLQNTKNNLQDAIKNINKGLYITDFIGMGVNLLTGNFSRGCNGILIENGELTYPVNEITISCNLLDVFNQMLPLDDLSVEYGVDSPSLYVENVTIGGM